MKKKGYQKLVSIAMTVALLGGVSPVALAATSNTATVSYTDISGNFAQQQIIQLTEDGYIHGYSNGTFRPNDPVTRGQFLAYLMNVLHVKPDLHAMQYFADVQPGNWDYSYVGAAIESGFDMGDNWKYWINAPIGGIFNENYQASWGDVASFLVGALESQQKLTLPPNTSPLSYMTAIGIFQGIPNTESHVYLDRASTAMVLSNILQYLQGTLTPQASQVDISGSYTTMPINSSEQLWTSATSINGDPVNLHEVPVTYQLENNPSGAFVTNSGELVVTAPGVYNVVATVQGVSSKPFQVTVYGAPDGMTLNAPSTQLVADGQATQTVTAQLVDANKTPVLNANGTMTVTDTQGWLVGANGMLTNTLTNVPVQNGVATFMVQSPLTAGLQDTVMGSDVVLTGSTTQLMNGSNQPVTESMTMTSVPQVATSVGVSASTPVVSNNVPTMATVYAQVLDQSGFPMLTGSFPLTFTMEGEGEFANNNLGPVTAQYNGSGVLQNPTTVQEVIDSLEGLSGKMTIAVTSPGLESGSVSLQSVTATAAVGISLHPALGDTADFTVTKGMTQFQAGPVDSEGISTELPPGDTYTAVMTQNGTSTTGATATVNANGLVTVSSTVSGTYTLTVGDAEGLLKPAVQTVVVSPGAAVNVRLSRQTVEVPTGAPTTTVQAQLVDAYGNPVAQAGVPITLQVTGGGSGQTANLSGSGSTVTLTTNEYGQVSSVFTAPPDAGSVWNVAADGVSNQTPTPIQTEQISVVAVVPSQLHAFLEDTNASDTTYFKSSMYAQAGDQITATVTSTDASGNTVPSNDEIFVTLPAQLAPASTNSNLTPTQTANVYTTPLVNGEVTLNLLGKTFGSGSLVLTDTNVVPSVTGTTSYTIENGPPVGAQVFVNGTPDANPLNYTTANTPVALTVQPIDAGGNPVTAQTNMTVNLSDGGHGGAFRLTPDGADVTQVTIPSGSASVTIYYVNANTGSEIVTAGTFDAQASRVSTSNTTQTVGQPVTITVTPTDQYGQSLGANQTVTVSDGTNVVNAVYNAITNVYTATFTETKAATYTYTATVNGVTLPQTAQVVY